jgi:uncharacterized protein YggE
MKKLICLLGLLCTITVISQECNNVISVVGETQKTVQEDNYNILITLQQIMVYEGQGEVEATSLEQVRENYIKKLEDAGIDFSRFRKNNYYEFAMSYSQNRESESYYLRTSNQNEVRKIIRLKSAGMSISNIELEAKKLTDKQLADLSIKAIDNAKQKAAIIAKNMNKTLGDIVSIIDANTSEQYTYNYGTKATQSHSVTVTFKIK